MGWTRHRHHSTAYLGRCCSQIFTSLVQRQCVDFQFLFRNIHMTYFMFAIFIQSFLLMVFWTNKLLTSISLSGNLELAKPHVENHYRVHQTARTAESDATIQRGRKDQIRKPNQRQSKFLLERGDIQYSPLAADFSWHL